MPAPKGNRNAEKEIDWNQLESLVAIQCTQEECASVLNIGVTTLSDKIKDKYGMSFRDYFKEKSGKGKASLRRRQFEMAKTNPTMAIWLGKNILNQKDSPLVDQSSHNHFVIIRPNEDTSKEVSRQVCFQSE